jgi:CheY-like chemotaxis protein
MTPVGSGRLRDVRVLVVDADTVARRAALMALVAEGASVTPVADAASAIAFAVLLRPDVIVADAEMGDGGGRRLLEVLRKRDELVATPIVAVSCGGPADGEAARLAGFAAHVSKPFDIETLRATVTRVALASALAPAHA